MSSAIHTTGFMRRPIDELVDAADDADGIDVRALRSGDTVLVHTCHSRYRLALCDPERGHVLATGDGAYLQQESSASVIGSSLSGRGTLVKSGWILVGYKLVLKIDGGELLTSRVRQVLINGRCLTPASGIH